MPLAAAGSLHPISGKLIRRLARRSQHRLLRAMLLFHDLPRLLIDGNGGSFLRIRGVKPLIQPLPERACVRDCPVGNISFGDGKFRFGKNCIGCVRCSFSCPKGAIHIGLIDFMRVNGPYDFSRDPDAAVTGRFCRKAYERCFSEGASDEKA